MAPTGTDFLMADSGSLLSLSVAWWGSGRTVGRLGRLRVPHPVCLCKPQVKAFMPRWLQWTYPAVQISPAGDHRLRRYIEWET